MRLVETLAATRKAWGASGKCATTNAIHYCSYSGAYTAGRATFSASKGMIVSISLTAAYDPTTKHFVSRTPLAGFHTSKGIHLGSTTAAVIHAYPKIERASAATELKLVAGRRSTLFLIFGGTVYSIVVEPTP